MKTNQKLELLDGKNNENVVTLSLGGRGCREAAGEGALNKECPKNTPSSVRWTPSPSQGEGHDELPHPCHAELDSASRCLKEERFRIKYGMTPLFNSIKAFTLIELLVVVLIIGILAGVALPQYNKAVLKARTTEIKSFLNAAEKGLMAYQMQNGGFTSQETLEPFIADQLDVDLSGFGKIEGGAVYAQSGNWISDVWSSGQVVLSTVPDKIGGDSVFAIDMSNTPTTYHCGYRSTTDKGKEICEAVANGDPRWVIELGS